jgi:hypothetical protein
MAGMANAELTLTRDRAAKTVRAVATCRILFNKFELSAMEQGLQFRLRAKLFGADALTRDDDLFTYTPYKIYPDATPGSIEDLTFEETLADEVLDESVILTDRIYAMFELTNLSTPQPPLRRKTAKVVGRA